MKNKQMNKLTSLSGNIGVYRDVRAEMDQNVERSNLEEMGIEEKKSSCPSADEWIRKLWCIYTVEYYSAMKKNAFESVPMRWIKLGPIIQSDVSQKEKHQYSILMHIYEI